MNADSPEPRFLSCSQVILIHAKMVELFGGMTGLRDESLLQSTVAQPMATFEGRFLHADVFEMAAAYAFHIAMNHPFQDGNRRTALAAAMTFLDENGYAVADEGHELADLILEMITEHRDKQWVAQQLRRRACPFDDKPAE